MPLGVLTRLQTEGKSESSDVRIARRLASAFIVYGMVAIAFLAVNMPPFQNPDEPAHFLRAAQLADGAIVAFRFRNGDSGLAAGGWADPELLAASDFHTLLAFHPEARATRANWASGVHWSENRVLAAFPGTALYPPFFYVPSAIGVLAGRLSGLSIVHTLILSRVLTGVTAVALAAMAILFAEAAAIWIFAVLTLPMSLSLISSPSQDALLLACSALAGSLWVRLVRSPNKPRPLDLACLALALGLVGMARPPYVPITLLPLALVRAPWRWRIVAALGGAGLSLLWSCVSAATAMTNFGAFLGADPRAQLVLLSEHPLFVMHVIWGTLAHYWHFYLLSSIGMLGWLDTTLPLRYYPVAGTIVAGAALATVLGSNGERKGKPHLVMAASVLLSTAGVFAIEYLTWTIPGGAIVEGVQGRYLLPILLIGTGLLSLGRAKKCERLRQALIVLVAVFPVVSLAVTMNAVIWRYYLQ
ncbi:MAG: DUF2142 domain-containing protein [Hyphomicrobiales bacterium]|nr:DUF2142 domain-containing protein [Hyphomicrobiales bacterium]MBV9434257.1 DUF2142 domain-containing protein [Hyphomicrobiales bacterium]